MHPVKIVIRDMPTSEALEAHIRKKAEKLEQYCDRITSFEIVVEIPTKHKHQGKLFHVRMDLAVPGKELVVNHKLNENAYVAVRDAFRAIIRQLEAYSEKRRGHVKSHDHMTHGYVTRLFPKDGYGFIQSLDGSELYFSTTSVVYPHFDDLIIGDSVQFIGTSGGDGWQAHHIIKGKRMNEETW